ncbi:MAG: CocE/NonD family hydrolase, partial [Calditrichales bacterium]
DNNYGGSEKKGNKVNWVAGFLNENLKDQSFDYKDPVYKNRTYNLFVMQRNEYFACDTWPPESVEFTPYYFGPDRYLSPDLPSAEGRIEFTYDPSEPFPNIGGTFLGINVGAAIQNDNLNRNDQLIFETKVLESELILLGPITASLYISSDVPSTDFFISLHDVMPNDTIINIQESGKKVEVLPGINKIDISVWATGYQLDPGHKLRVVITSALFPRFNRNLNSNEPIFSAREMRQAHQAVYYGAHPSSVTLPILKLKDEQKFEE